MSLPIIDTHQHLWDLYQLELPWLPKDGNRSLIEHGNLRRNYLLEHYWHEASGLNIVKTVYMEVDVRPDHKAKEARLVLDWCRDKANRMVGAVIGGNPTGDDFKEYIREFLGEPELKGVRQVLHGGQPRGYCLEPKFVERVQWLGQHGLRFDLCLRPDELSDGADLAELCPETQFILDHCGNAPVYGDRTDWERGLEEIAECPNVMCKISGIVAQCKLGEWEPVDLAPIVYRCRRAFGIDRLMFASDWPVCTLAASLREWVTALQTIVQTWSEEDRRKLFHDNAERFYAL
jgi:L-fuconolactonase